MKKSIVKNLFAMSIVMACLYSICTVIFYAESVPVVSQEGTFSGQSEKQMPILDSIDSVSTDKLIISLAIEEDCANLAKYYKDKEIQRYLGKGEVDLSEEEAQANLKIILDDSHKEYEYSKSKAFTIKNLNNEPMGQIYLGENFDNLNSIVFSYWIGKPFRGNSIVPDAVCALISQVCDKDIHIEIACEIENQKSQKAIMKIGEKLGAFTRDSQGNYIPCNFKKDGLCLFEKNLYRSEQLPLENDKSQINIRLYKNEELIFSENISKSELDVAPIRDKHMVQSIFAKR